MPRLPQTLPLPQAKRAQRAGDRGGTGVPTATRRRPAGRPGCIRRTGKRGCEPTRWRPGSRQWTRQLALCNRDGIGSPAGGLPRSAACTPLEPSQGAPTAAVAPWWAMPTSSASTLHALPGPWIRPANVITLPITRQARDCIPHCIGASSRLVLKRKIQSTALHALGT